MFKIASLLFIQTSILLGAYQVVATESLPEFCYSQRWVVENKKPVLKKMRKSNSALSLPQRYACQYPQMGQLSNAIYKSKLVADDSTCTECNTYNGQRQMMVDYKDLIHKVGLIGKHDSRKIPKKKDERRYSATGSIYCDRCGTEGSTGSGTLVVSPGVVITAAHLFFDGKSCAALNGNEKVWWNGYVFSIIENGKYKDYEIDRAKTLAKCIDDNELDDIVILKLKEKIKYKGSLVNPYNLVVLDQKKYKRIKKNRNTIISAYGSESMTKNGYLEDSDGDLRWFINKNIPLEKYHFQDGRPWLEHTGDTTGGASGGSLFYKNGQSYDVYAIHKGTFKKDDSNRPIRNGAIGIRREIVDIVEDYASSFDTVSF